ncbi:MAG: 50S ribosomal protein L25 [Planctomycetes bacterium]|nr:50S ribosomal protein L25 [Planctomycetota bacterium]
MQATPLKAEVRTGTGKSAVRLLRRQAKVPAVLYGQGQPSQPLTITNDEVRAAIKRNVRLVDVTLPNAVHKAFIKQVQYDPLGERVLHLDLERVDLTKEIAVVVEIILKGRAVGLNEGGVVEHELKQLTVHCLPTNIPAFIEVDVSALKKDSAIYVKELHLPAGVRITVNPEQIVVACREPQLEEVATAATALPGPLEPEVITAKKPEEGAEGAEAGKGAAGAAKGKEPAAKEGDKKEKK